MIRDMVDSLVNFVSGLGTSKDKSAQSQYILNLLTRNQVEAAYRGDWLARKAISVPPADATRKWRAWQAEDAQVQKIEAEEKRLDVQAKVLSALIKARLYGGAIIFLGVREDDPFTPLDPLSVKAGELRYINVLSRNLATAGELETDVRLPGYGLPRWYEIAGGPLVRIHPSRVIRFIGAPYPDDDTMADGWGDSVLLGINDALRSASEVVQGTTALVPESKLDIIRVPNLMSQIGTAEYRNRLTQRFQLANITKSTLNALLLDKEEEWERKEITFTGLPDLERLALMVAAGAVDMPATRLLGQSPVGMNATGDSDTRNYYDRVSADQENTIRPALSILDECLIGSALGSRPPEIHYSWNPLWQMDDVQKADVGLKKAQAYAIDVNSGLIPDGALAKGRMNQLVEDGVYPGLEAALEDAHMDDLDEGDPDASAQFSMRGAAPESEPVQATALTGAQIQSLQDIVVAVVNKELPAESAVQLIMVGFPAISEAVARKIIEPLAIFEKPTPTAPLAAVIPPVPGNGEE
jgi:hypothetical protein